VSVIRRSPDGTWHGDMLDGLAFVKAQKDHGAQPEGARVLLVGAGGAGSAIAIALLEAGVANSSSTTPTSRGSPHCSTCSRT
jgi:shikimate 5-dehydrogenase